MTDDEEDIRDAALFRYWCRMASWPGGDPVRVAKEIANCTTVTAYRETLTKMALSDGINLP